MRWAIAVLAIAASGCVSASLVPCGDVVCAENDKCVANQCTSPDQIAACYGKVDGETCMLGLVAGLCQTGACRVAICGNGIVEPPEVCDDGNQRSGDGCSATCNSNETCGNGVVDYAVGEECDDGEFGQSADGCSSTCFLELDTWRLLVPEPTNRSRHAITYDPRRDVVVMFGGIHLNYATNELYEFDGRNWIARHSDTTPSQRSDAMLAYDEISNRTIMFGGLDVSQSALADTWAWDGVNWKQLSPPVSPPARARGMMTYDANRKKVVLFGGNAPTTPVTVYGDTWEFDGSSGTWTIAPANMTVPSARIQGVLVFDVSTNQTMLFGGARSAGAAYQNDTWAWTGTWTRLAPPNSPPAIRGATAAWDPVNNVIVMNGGATLDAMNAQVTVPDTWLWNGTTWQQLAGISGGQFVLAAAATQPGIVGVRPTRIVQFGGSNVNGGGATATTALWDAATMTWTASATPASPVPRRGIAVATDLYRGRVVVFGGEGPLADTWEWDGTSWRQRQLSSDPNAPVARGHAALAYDRSRRASVLFGGYIGATAVSAATDLWDGAMWTHRPSTSGDPPARGDALMAYDAKDGVTVMTAGSVPGTAVPLTDTWEWNGGWTMRDAIGPGLQLTAITYDDAVGAVVALDDTDHQMWRWDRVKFQWIPIGDPQPNLSIGASIAYDPLRKSVVMFGSNARANATGATWEWNGNTWSMRFPTTSPNDRQNGALTYDPNSHGLLIVGGLDAMSAAPDTWIYEFVSGHPPDTCTGTSDSDMDGLKGCADPDCAPRCTPLCLPGDMCTGGPTCGDGTCDPLEDYMLCAADCPAPP